MTNQYSQTILAQAPRILSLLDRNPFSPTYGCFDRNYWHNQITDFSCARFQEACLTLTLLYCSPFDKKYFHNRLIKNWAIAAIKHWVKIQQADGSFNEWYPFEHSFVATAFTLYAVTESYLLLRLQSPAILEAIVKSADWLAAQSEFTAANQQTGAIVALYNVFLITKNKFYRQAAESKFKELAKIQSVEGWFSEYGGADIGYSSVAVDYLAKYYQKSKNPQVLIVLKKLSNFYQYFIHPNFTFGGGYGSRNTEYSLPHGWEILSRKKIQSAQMISQATLNHLSHHYLSLDDRYLCYNGYVWLQAALDYSPHKNSPFLWDKIFSKYFNQSGNYIYSDSKTYTIINLFKGGTIKRYSKKTHELLYDSSGIIGELSNRQLVSSQWLDRSYKVSVKPDLVFVSGKLHRIKLITLSPVMQILSRFFQLSFCRSLKVSLFLKKILRQKLILHSKLTPIKFSRQFLFNQDKLTIITKISLKNSIKFKCLSYHEKFSLIYVPSTRFFNQEELVNQASKLSPAQITKLNQTRTLALTEVVE